MKEYKRLTIEEAGNLTINDLIRKYNDSVEEILYLNYRIKELNKEIDLWQAAYDEVSDALWG